MSTPPGNIGSYTVLGQGNTDLPLDIEVVLWTAQIAYPRNVVETEAVVVLEAAQSVILQEVSLQTFKTVSK